MPRAFVPHHCGLIMVFFCMTVFVCGWAIYNFIVVKQMLPAIGLGSLAPVFIALFNSVWCLAVWSYFRTRCTAAGGNTAEWREFVVKRNLAVASSLPEWQPAQATFCTKCGEARPERAHHCSASGVCVLRMDHYCPWTAACVGFLNHKFFLLLATYNFLSVLVFFVTVLPIALYVAKESYSGRTDMPPLTVQGLVFIGCVVSGVCSYLLGEMVMDHVSKGLKNLTSIEDEYENMPNPFDLGHWYPNLSQIMGAFGLDWFFPVMPWKPQSDGLSFARFWDGEHGTSPLNDRQDDVWVRTYIECAVPMTLAHNSSDSDSASEGSGSGMEDSARLDDSARRSCF